MVVGNIEWLTANVFVHDLEQVAVVSCELGYLYIQEHRGEATLSGRSLRPDDFRNCSAGIARWSTSWANMLRFLG